MTAGYDGMQYTLHFDPDYDKLWGEGADEYQTVPSFVAPPQFIASIITSVMFKPASSRTRKVCQVVTWLT
jgi:hypothetical protein